MAEAAKPSMLDPSLPGASARWTEHMQNELKAVLAHRHLEKSPKLERLLIYLVEQTLAGHGDTLKSYVVGVEGLGKDPDFDPNIDSYPRVQVMRLRKLLEAYYARHAPVDDYCLYIPAGSYSVQLARRAKAYPELIAAARAEPNASVLSAAPLMHATASLTPRDSAAADDLYRAGPDAEALPLTSSRLASFRSHGGQRSRFWPAAGTALVAGAVAFAGLLAIIMPSQEREVAVQTSSNRPILVMEQPTTGTDSNSRAMADEAYSKLADSIGRFWVVQLRLVAPTEDPARIEGSSYRLAIQLGEKESEARPLYLRLTDERSGTLVWANTANLNDGQSLSEELGKSIVRLASPFGVIAEREIRRTNGDFSVGYACLLRYVDNLNSPKPQLSAKLATCLATPIDNPRLDAVRLGLLSFHTLETAPSGNRKASIAKALSLAERAINADSTETYAHFAMARIFYVANNCASGLMSTRYAMEANPYDPIMLAVLGNFASQCGDPLGSQMLQRAFEFRSPGESYARLWLILAAIRSGRTEQLSALTAEAENVPGINDAYHHLCQALIAAAMDDIPQAKDEWRKFAAESAAPYGSPHEMMQRIVFSQQVRDRIITFLQAKQVLPPTPR